MTKVFKNKIWFVSLNMRYNVLCVNIFHSEQNMDFLNSIYMLLQRQIHRLKLLISLIFKKSS